MGNHFQAIVFPDATPVNAQELASNVVKGLVTKGLIDPTLDHSCVLGDGGGYKPSNRISDFYDENHDEPVFWRFVALNGVELMTERWFNYYGWEGIRQLQCPGCKVELDAPSDTADSLFTASASWIKDGNGNPVDCPKCGIASPVTKWKTVPYLGCVHLSFLFWNWPFFDSSQWKINVPALVSEISGCETRVTCAKV